MSIFKILFYILFFLLTTNLSFTQSKKITDESIIELIILSNKALDNFDFKKSFEINELAIKNAYKINSNSSIAACYNNIAYNYEEILEHKQAIEYYNLALKYALKANDKKMQNYIYNNKANIYSYYFKKPKLGIKFYKKAVELSEILNDTVDAAFTKTNLALAYFCDNQDQNALATLDYLNKNSKFLDSDSSIATMLMLNALGENTKGNNDKSEKLFQESIAFAVKKNLKSDLLTIYEEYYLFLKKTKNFEKSITYLEKLSALKSEMSNEKVIKNAQLIGKTIDLDVYKNEYKRSETENKAQKIIINKNKIINSLFLLMFFTFILFLFLIIKNNKSKQKANKLLAQNNLELEIANVKAVESAKLKSQFVSTISHELRTPLYGVIGITNMLIEEQKELSTNKHLKSLEFSANYLLSLVNDILHINKIDEKKIILENQNFNFKEEIFLIKNALDFISENNNNQVFINFDKNIPEILNGDKIRLDQIMMNLLSNALKFTKNGKIFINLYLIEFKENKNFIKFEIQDTGVGIAEENLYKIFEKFVQVGDKNEEYQGTGLGLSIVKKLLELHQSKILVKSEVGVGTTFTFTIGFENAKDDFQKNPQLKKVFLNTIKRNILVVEDNKINQMVTKKIIENNNSTCTITENGYFSLAILEKEKFDVILMDINMPIINGYETTKLIRKKGIKVPIIALTAYSKSEISEKVYASGMNGILIKPFEQEKLFEIINEQLNIV